MQLVSPCYLNTQPIKAACSGITNLFISSIISNPGLVGATLISGVALGIFTVWVVDRDSSLGKDFQNRWKYLIGTGITILTVAGAVVVSLANEINVTTAILFAALSLGVVIGVQIKEYYNRNSDQKINEFLQRFKASSTYRVWDGLNLSGYRGCMSYFNLPKLGQKIHEGFDTNSKLELLDLSDTDLTDDNLKKMAQTGLFNNVLRLVLSDNPRLTGKGIAWIAEKGFTSLERLDLTSNKQVIKTDLNEWIEKDGFKNLKSLDLTATGITENELEQIIEKAEWFRKLKGLNLDCNNELIKFPSNILKLTNLDDHTVSDGQLMSGGRVYFHGSGIFCRGCNLICTKELLILADKGKVFGEANKRSLNVRNIFKRVDIKRICEHYNMPVWEVD
jgi:hypothetical protein